jgi:hypothetical protein
MKAGSSVIALALSLMALSPALVAADVSDPGSPHFANRMFGDFSTPTVAPGSILTFAFNVTNPYEDDSDIMDDIVITIGVYRYSTQETSREVDEDFKDPPILDHVGIEAFKEFDMLLPGSSEHVELHISTSKDTPHGSYFSQSTYFMRFRVAFHFLGNSTEVMLQSRGFFTDEQWNEMVNFTSGESIVNTDYMKSLGVDGIIPDSAFGLKEPIPVWPLELLVAGILVVSIMSTYYYVLDNPGKHPWLEQRFYYLRGKLRELRSQLKDRRRK